jgi:rare lipoprotein A
MGPHIDLPEACLTRGRSGWSPRATRRVAFLPLLAALLVSAAACAGRRGPEARPVRPGWEQTGLASWYGAPFHGRITASGERYDQEGMTAAHKFLPFGTWVRVENLENDRTIRVRITDRGPFVEGRIIDLSRAAARDLDLIGPGTGRVRITVVDVSGCHAVQVASFAERERALERRAALEEAGTPAFLESGPDGNTRVLLGPYPSRAAAERAREDGRGWIRSCPDLEGAADG